MVPKEGRPGLKQGSLLLLFRSTMSAKFVEGFAQMILKTRRIFTSNPPRTYIKRFSPRQLHLMGLLADPADKRPLVEKARAAGVCRRTVFNWRKLLGWKEAELFLWRVKLDLRLQQGRERIERDSQYVFWYGKRPPKNSS